jgi:hypothetical protein
MCPGGWKAPHFFFLEGTMGVVNRKWTDEERQLAVDLFNDGWGTKEVAAFMSAQNLHRSPITKSSIIRQLQIARRRGAAIRHHLSPRLERIAAYRKNVTVKQDARAFLAWRSGRG